MHRLTASLAIALLLLAIHVACAQQLTGLPEPLRAELRAADELPPGAYAPVQTWAAETAGHRTGRLVDDPGAVGGKAWEVMPDTDADGTMLYGPYLEPPPGDYVAFFRIKLLAADDDTLGSLDACANFAQTMLAARDLAASDLTVGQYVQLPLGFRYEKGQLECRLNWNGSCGLRVDEIALFRLTGAPLDSRAWRAPAPALSGAPKELVPVAEPRPFPDIFPQPPPPARELLVCDLRRERPDTRLMMLSLQGLVNRTQPRLYCLTVETDPFWLENMQARRFIAGFQPATPAELITRFRDTFKGVIITDPQLPASRNVATMLAGVNDGLVVSPRLAQQHRALPVLDDLRGRWTTSAAATRWAFDHLWPRLNHHVLACLWPDHVGLRDTLVANRIFTFWIAGPLDGARKYADPTAEVRLMEELLAKMPANIPVLGYPWAGQDVGIGEGPGVTLFAEFGKYLVGSIDATNLSVHAGIVIPPLKQKPAPPVPALQPDKVYLTPIMSDGDNLPVLSLNNFPQLWADQRRGQFPMGWTLSPAACLLMPDIVDYYYRTATPQDQFLGAVSGVGYTYADSYGKRFRAPHRERALDGFLAQTAQTMKQSDLRDLWIMNATRPEIIARYAERLPDLDALFPDYGRRLSPGDNVTYPTARNIPVFHATSGWLERGTREERIAQLVGDVRRMTPATRPAFMHFFIWNWGADLPLLQEVFRQLGPDYVLVRPDHLATLWREQMAREKIVARFPRAVAALEGQGVTLQGELRNVAARPETVQLRVAAGLTQASVKPSRADLKPAQAIAVSVAGVPTAPTIELELTGSFGTHRESVSVRLTRLAELLTPLPQGARLSPVAYLEAVNLPHRSGQSQADTDALGGTVWAVTPGQAEAGYVVFGPYAPLPAGRYVALFRLKRTGPGEGVVTAVDTCVGGGAPQTGRAEMTVEDLPLGQYRLCPIVFSHPGGQYETRIQWAGTTALAIDGIGVWRVER